MPREPRDPPRPSDESTWLVPLATVLAVLVGAGIASQVGQSLDPSGIIQPPGSPIPNQLSDGVVILLIGAPFAALAAAVTAYLGLWARRSWQFALLGILAGVAVFATIGADVLSLGNWWLTAVPSDTNQAAALFAFLLAPPGALATQLAVSTATVSPEGRRGTLLARYTLVGILIGMLLGSLLGSLAAVQTWAIHCPANNDLNCFSPSSVLDGGLLVGGLSGMVAGAVTGSIAWAVRRRRAPADVPSS